MNKSGATSAIRMQIYQHQHERFEFMHGAVNKDKLLPRGWNYQSNLERFKRWQVKDDFGR